MPWQGWLALGILVATFLLCALTRLAADAVFIGGLMILTLSGVLPIDKALAGFSNSGMITVAFLYVVVSGMQQTGGLNWISRHILGLPRGLTRALLRLTLPVIGLSAFLNNTPVVAMFIPVVNDWARKLRLSPSKLMIPLSYATILGGTVTMIGTSTNLVVNGLLEKHTGTGMQLFSIAPVGLVTVAVGVLYLLLFSRLLPDRRPVISDAADPRQYTVEMLVEAGSPLSGQTIESAGMRHLPNLFLMEIDRAGHVLPAVGRKEVLQAGDRLIFVGAVESILDLRNFRGLVPATNQVFKLDAPPAERCLIEAVVSNTCPIVGLSIREGRFRTLYNAAILAVARNGERLSGKIGDIVLRPGDTLLLEARPSFIERQRASRDFYLVSGVPDSELLLHERAPLAVAIMVAMVLAAAFNWLSMLSASMLGAGLMVATGCCSMDRARRSIEWQVLVVIGAALAIGEALETTGAAAALAHALMHFAGGHNLGALAVVYFTTMLLTEFITNNAAAALMFPIAMATAASLGVSHLPFAVAVMFAASASFATPIGYQTNLMVYGPGGYRFGDFLRFGVPLNLILWLAAMFTIPACFPF
ncbi:MAG: SLC13 family permease [Lentisphaerae bacterium]|nr:SLC13 family permease [Lentisphaerota bacterium]